MVFVSRELGGLKPIRGSYRGARYFAEKFRRNRNFQWTENCTGSLDLFVSGKVPVYIPLEKRPFHIILEVETVVSAVLSIPRVVAWNGTFGLPRNSLEFCSCSPREIANPIRSYTYSLQNQVRLFSWDSKKMSQNLPPRISSGFFGTLLFTEFCREVFC